MALIIDIPERCPQPACGLPWRCVIAWHMEGRTIVRAECDCGNVLQSYDAPPRRAIAVVMPIARKKSGAA
jgi:hypothetical protein